MHITTDRGTSSDSETNVGRIEPGALHALWPTLSAHIEKYGKEWLKVVALEDIFHNVLSGRMILWAGLDEKNELECLAACLWECHSQQQFFYVVWVGGKNLRRYAGPGLEKIEKWCLLFEGSEVVIIARKGLERMLRRFGYVNKYVHLSKNVRRTRGN